MAYKDIEKPRNLIEIEGRCPLCNTVMSETKSACHDQRLYTFSFPIYLCIAHHHGHFRWLGGGRGHVRALFPQILRYGRVIGECPKEERFELMSITCPDCGFSWEEIKFPHDTTYCPDCRNEVDLSGYFEKRK